MPAGEMSAEIKVLEEVGHARWIDADEIDAAQAVRFHRNRLVHQRIERRAAAMTVEAASTRLLTYLSRLPERWG